jgi:hypothetical protein
MQIIFLIICTTLITALWLFFGLSSLTDVKLQCDKNKIHCKIIDSRAQIYNKADAKKLVFVPKESQKTKQDEKAQ